MPSFGGGPSGAPSSIAWPVSSITMSAACGLEPDAGGIDRLPPINPGGAAMAELVAQVVRERPVLVPSVSRGRRHQLSSWLTALACLAVLLAAGLLMPARARHP